MKPDRWRKVDELFEAALEREPERRAAFLDEVCGSDKELRLEVEKMLDFDNQAQEFIKTDVFDFAARLITQPRENASSKKSLITSDSIDARFVPGDTRIGRVPQDKAVEVARQLCAGLAAVHERGVLHRDLKPANIMLDEHGDVRITDFGIAALANEDRREISGTPAYMSPEQLEGHELTTKSDIYSLGLVLYEVFTGRKAF